MSTPLQQTLVGAGTVVLALMLAAGAALIPSAAGYQGVGPNFLPWVVALVLLVCGVCLVYEARTGGYRHREAPSGGSSGHWPGFAWISAGILLNAALINHLGFILSCTGCFVCAVRAFRVSMGDSPPGLAGWVTDALTGMAIAAPVYWMFTQLLAINLPGLTRTGWF